MTALPLDLGEAVADALSGGAPVVALESTIVTHGMAWPRNLETALGVEEVVRRGGAVPATIAVVGGRLRVGLGEAEIEALARAGGVAKLSRADLAHCMARGGTGSTTVAATMIAARAAGIEVFATGGIGGVHRGGEASMDVSADLQELAQTAVTVVCAGAKAILDLPRTLEVLETLGVPVIAHGQDAFPAFWSRDGGMRAPLRSDAAGEIARAHRLRGALGLPGGQLVANPGAGGARGAGRHARPPDRARGRGGGGRGRDRQGGDAVPPVAAGGADGRGDAGVERGPDPVQRGARGRDRRRAVRPAPELSHAGTRRVAPGRPGAYVRRPSSRPRPRP